MKNGWGIIDLIFLILFLSIIFSVIFPVSKRWIDKILVDSEIKEITSSIRYAKYLSYAFKDKVIVNLSKSIMIKTPNEIKEKGKLSLINVKFFGNKDQGYFAFSHGIPYESGKMAIYFRGTKIATVTVMPITGLIKVEQRW